MTKTNQWDHYKIHAKMLKELNDHIATALAAIMKILNTRLVTTLLETLRAIWKDQNLATLPLTFLFWVFSDLTRTSNVDATVVMVLDAPVDVYLFPIMTLSNATLLSVGEILSWNYLGPFHCIYMYISYTTLQRMRRNSRMQFEFRDRGLKPYFRRT